MSKKKLYIFCLFVFLLVLPSISADMTNASVYGNMTLYMTFDSSDGNLSIDNSTKPQFETRLSGTVKQSNISFIGNASFYGATASDYINITSQAQFNEMKNFTVMCSINSTTAVAGMVSRNHGDGTNGEWNIDVRQGVNSIVFGYADLAGSANCAPANNIMTGHYNFIWGRVNITSDPGAVSITSGYNATECATSAGAVTSTNTTKNIALGLQRVDQPSGSMTGGIDDCIIVNKSMNTNEIANIWNLMKAGIRYPVTASVASDTTPPIINGSLNKTRNYFRYDILNASFNITDETGLNTCQIIENQTGARKFFNFTLSGTSDKCSLNITLTAPYKTIVNITGRVNDTSGNFQQNDTLIIIGRNKTFTPVEGFNRATNATLCSSLDTEDFTNQFRPACAWGENELSTTAFTISSNQLSCAFAALGEGSYIEVNASPQALTSLNGSQLCINQTTSTGVASSNDIVKIFSNNILGYRLKVTDSALFGTTMSDEGGTIMAGIPSPYSFCLIDNGLGSGSVDNNILINFMDSTMTKGNGTNFTRNAENSLNNITGIQVCVQNNSVVGTQTIGSLHFGNGTVGLNLDLMPPSVNITSNNSAPKIGEKINISSGVTDNIALSYCRFQDNGCLANGALNFFNYSVTGTADRCSQNYTTRISRGNVLNYTIVVNDTSQNTNTTSLAITVADTLLSFTNFINTTDLTYNRNQTINFTFTDPDKIAGGDTILCDVYSDQNNPPTTNISNDITDQNFTTNMTADGKYFVNVTCSSGGAFAYSTIFNITLDVSTPSCSGIPLNGTFYNRFFNVSSTCTDNIQLFEVNGTIRTLGQNTAILNTSNRTNITTAGYIFNMTINVSHLGDGLFNYTQYAGDTKNDNKKMPSTVTVVKDKLDKTKTNNNIFVFMDSATGLQINITVLINKTKLEQPKDSQNLEINFTLIDGDYFKLTVAYDSSEDNQSTIFNFTSNQNIIEVNDGFSTHLLLGNGKDKLSYDSNDATADFTPSLRKESNSAIIEFTPKASITKGERLVIDPIIDNLNIQEYSIVFEVDITLPQFFILNATNKTTLLNNSYLGTSNPIFTFNVSDKNNASVLTYLNDNKNASRGYISNLTHNITLSNVPDGNYSLNLIINDSAGNFLNSTRISFVVDTELPVSANATNKTRTGSRDIRTNTDVNISVILKDIYLDRGNFSHNASGVWTNHSISVNGNNTYGYIIGAGNFTPSQEVGWKFYAYDLAGNELDPIFTFVVYQPSTGGTPEGGSGGGGGSTTSQVNIPITLTNPFGTQPINGQCQIGEQMLDAKCYACSLNGYLDFNPNDRSVVCKSCNEGYEMIDKQCFLKPTTTTWKSFINGKIDYYALKISTLFGTSNLLVGFVVMGLMLFSSLYYGIPYLNKAFGGK